MSRTYRSNVDGHSKQQADTLARYFARTAKQANHKVRESEQAFRQAEPVHYNEGGSWFEQGLLPSLLNDERGEVTALGLVMLFVLLYALVIRLGDLNLWSDDNGSFDVDPIVVIAIYLWSLGLAFLLVTSAVVLCNLRSIVARLAVYGADILFQLSKVISWLAVKPWQLLQDATVRVIQSSFRARLIILFAMGLFFWSMGCRALTSSPVDDVENRAWNTRQSVDSTEDILFGDVGSLFLGAFIVGGVSIGRALDRKDKAKRGTVVPVSSTVMDAVGLDAWENEGGAIYDAN